MTTNLDETMLSFAVSVGVVSAVLFGLQRLPRFVWYGELNEQGQVVAYWREVL